MKQDIYGENQDLRIKVIRLEKENKKLQLDNKELKEKFSLYAVSHRRELLVECSKKLENDCKDKSIEQITMDYIVSTNCG
jgi:regulator of replication initiation timing